MLFLQSFYDASSLWDSSTPTLLPEPLNLTLPDLDIYTSTVSDIYHKDELLVLDLNKTAQAYREKWTISHLVLKN